MRKMTILLLGFLLFYGIAQANTYRPGEARISPFTSNTLAWDSITVDAKDTTGTVLLHTALSGLTKMAVKWTYTVGAWDGQIIEESKLWLTNGDSLRGVDIYIVRPIPEVGDTIKNFATPGDAMALTTAERGALEDSIYANRTGYKADVSALMTLAAIADSSLASTGDAMTLTTGEEATIADSVWVTVEALALLFFNAADSVKSWPPDSLVYYYAADSVKKIYSISNGKVTKWVKE